MFKHKKVILALYIFCMQVLFASSSFALVDTNFYGWGALGSGIGGSGEVNAITIFNGNVIAGGSFNQAGSLVANNIALWNGTSWSPLHTGVNGTVYALTVFNGELIAGGNFSNAGGTSVSNIARWNGSTWSALGTGVNDEVQALTVYNGELVAGGSFDNKGNYIARWNGTTWQSLGQGVNDQVHALTVFEGALIAAGRFTQAGSISASRVARWNGTSWTAINGQTFDERAFALTVYNNQLVMGGRFENEDRNYLVYFNGTTWQEFGNGVNDRIYSLAVFNGDLVAGGQHEHTYYGFVNRISLWDGTQWRAMGTGTGEKVNALAVRDSSLFAGGEFSFAGGYRANRIAEWSKRQTTTVSGMVRYNANNLPATGGKVYALRLDLYLRQVIKVDSAVIGTDGRYRLAKVPTSDKSIILTQADDELDFVPTYFPATTAWENAVYINPVNNLDSINIKVSSINTDAPGGAVISGIVDLNYVPLNLLAGEGPFKSDAIVYVSSGSEFKGYGISRNNESYSIPPLSPGQYTLTVNRIGYETETVAINVTANQTVNFILDTVKYTVNINQISAVTPENFNLHQNYPNPFNPSTKIKFDLLRSSFISLSIFDASGRKIADIANNELKNSGTYEMQFTAKNLPSGVYFYRLEARDKELSSVFTETKKMILVK